MKTISRYIMTLVALLALTTQAWATDVYVVGNGNGTGTWLNGVAWAPDAPANKMTEQNGVYSITFTNVGANPELLFKFAINGTWNENFGCISTTENKLNKTLSNIEADGYNIMFVLTEAADVTISFNLSELTYMISTNGMKVGDDTPVEWDAATKTGTFAMPASDVVLTPIYSAATISHAAGTPDASETPFETLKEAFAAVQDGDVITLDWNVTLTETLKTPSTASDISFTLDFNGFVIDNTGGTNYIVIDNGCELTLTDNSTAQTGGLKCQQPIAGSNGGKVIFQGGRYSFNGSTAEQIASGWDEMVTNYGWALAEGKEFVDIENAPDANGFMVRVGYKAIELTIGAGKFATFYMDQNVTLADGTDTNIGLYTIEGSGINLDNNTVTVTKVNDPIAIAGMPLLVYNGTTEQNTVTLRVTPDQPTAGQMWSSHFQGTATDKTFTDVDMAANDYFALSGGKAFAPVRGTGTIAKNKCWLEFTKNNGNARQLTIVFDSEATGIRSMDNGQLIMDNWYDLNGRKLNAKPTRKGVYIKNGQKVVK